MSLDSLFLLPPGGHFRSNIGVLGIMKIPFLAPFSSSVHPGSNVRVQLRKRRFLLQSGGQLGNSIQVYVLRKSYSVLPSWASLEEHMHVRDQEK